MSLDAVKLTVHPPERGRRPIVLGSGCCTTCCCCCCLHSVGAIVGAKRAAGEALADNPASESVREAVRAYWGATVGLTIAFGIFGTPLAPIFGMPIIMVFSYLMNLAAVSRLEDPPAARKAITEITRGMLTGTFVWGLVMVGAIYIPIFVLGLFG